MQKRGKQLQPTPMDLHAHPELKRKRNVWMFANYQRPKVTFVSYLDRTTIHFPLHSLFAHHVMSFSKSVPHTFKSYFQPLALFPAWSVPPADGRTRLFMIRIWLHSFCTGTSRIQISWVAFLTYPCHTSIIFTTLFCNIFKRTHFT